MTDFKGIKYKDASNWIGYVPQPSGPIRYLEIGVLCGNNVLSVESLYAAHPDSVLVCVDPWIDYGDYPEYKGVITTYYDYFCQNTASIAQKLEVYRDYSHRVLPHLGRRVLRPYLHRRQPRDMLCARGCSPCLPQTQTRRVVGV
jgi:hypothetical protein